jgi:hypothetical protein
MEKENCALLKTKLNIKIIPRDNTLINAGNGLINDLYFN